MRSVRIGAFAAAVALVAASAALAGDVPSSKGEWTSFKPGAWITVRLSIKTIPEVPSQMGEREHRTTLVSVNDEEYVLRSETKSEDTWTDLEEETHSRKPTADDDDAEKKPAPAKVLGDEKLSIGGTVYVCKKLKAVSDGETEITWVHKVHGKLKSETMGPGDMKSTSTVTSLAKKVTIAGKKISCREEKSVSSGEGMETTIVHLTSDEVPNSLVRMDIRGISREVTIITVIELTGFDATTTDVK